MGNYKLTGDNIMNTYKVTFRGFIEDGVHGLLTEDDYYTIDTVDEDSAALIVHSVNENRENPLYDIKVVSVEKISKE